MGIIDMIPMSIRMLLLYVNSKKVTKRQNMSEAQKLEAIRRKESFWKGNEGFAPTTVGEIQSPAVAIGMRDMASIYCSLHAPNDALRHLNAIGTSLMDNYNSLPNDQQHAHKRQSIYEAQIFAWLHEADAYAQLKNTDRVRLLFDKINQTQLASIESDPSNKRLHDFYHQCIQQAFDTFIGMANSNPDIKQNIYQTCLKLLKTFDRRDPGNDTITELIERFH